MVKGRHQQEVKQAMTARNPISSRMEGSSVMATSVQKSRFKSAFGDLAPIPKRLNPKALHKNRRAK